MEQLFDRFRDYVQQTAGHPVVWGEPAAASLPAYLAQRYATRWLSVGGQPWLAVLLKRPEPTPPLVLNRQLAQLAERLGTKLERICLVAEQLPSYLRRRLIELGQTFVIPGRQLFWPALGSAETLQRPRRLQPEPVEQLSPVAQQLLLALLLRSLPDLVSINGTAEVLGCSTMTVSRAVKELEGGGLIRSEIRGKARSFKLEDSSRSTWIRVQTLLRNPVLRQLRVRQEVVGRATLTLAGESALAEFSNLGAPEEPVFAIASRAWTQRFSTEVEVPLPDEGCCLIQLWRYPPEGTARRGIVDPLSLHLSLRDCPDERVQQALDTLLEQVPW